MTGQKQFAVDITGSRQFWSHIASFPPCFRYSSNDQL